MYPEERKVSDFIQKIKVFFAIINTIITEIGLYRDGADWIMLIVGLVMIPLSSAIWNESFYYALQEEKPFNMSLYVFERVTLIFPIGIFIATVGLTIR